MLADAVDRSAAHRDRGAERDKAAFVRGDIIISAESSATTLRVRVVGVVAHDASLGSSLSEGVVSSSGAPERKAETSMAEAAGGPLCRYAPGTQEAETLLIN